MKILILAAVLVLSGCATAPKPEVVEIPVAIGCMGDRPARPAPVFGAGEYPGDKAAAQAALKDAAAWEGYATGLEAAMAGCEKKLVK